MILGGYGTAIERLTQIVVLPDSSAGVRSLPSHIVVRGRACSSAAGVSEHWDRPYA